MTPDDQVRRDFLDMPTGPIHPTLDGVFVHPHRPAGGANSSLFGDHRQRLKHLFTRRAQPIEKRPLGLGEGLAARPTQILRRGTGSVITMTFQLPTFFLAKARAARIRTIQTIG
jgi:hypothetical protein